MRQCLLLSNFHPQENANLDQSQLCVAKGLVIDRLQKVSIGHAVMKSRFCRASYGFLHKEEYNPEANRHLGRNPVRDPLDGRYYVDDMIKWVVKKVSILALYQHQYQRFER